MATKSTKKTAPKKGATKKSGTAAVVAGAGAVALTAAAAGAAGYYFYGTAKAKKHRQAASAWAKGLKKDVTSKIKTLKKIDSKAIAQAVDDAAAAYQGVRGVASTDVKLAATELKKNWKMLEREFAPSKEVRKTVKKVEKTIASVAPKKTAKKR